MYDLCLHCMSILPHLKITGEWKIRCLNFPREVKIIEEI